MIEVRDQEIENFNFTIRAFDGHRELGNTRNDPK
jgi:hypothetical protein